VNGKGLIAFHSNREGGYQIYVMESDGTDIRKLTDFPPPNSEPTWAPDGSRIAFTSGKDDISNFTLYTIAADGTNPRRLLEPVKGDNWYPTWSPQGDKIAFQSNRDGNFEIYIVEVKTGEVTRLTNNQATDSMPNWSPDGEKIVFVSDAKGDAEIHVMNADGTNRMRLTQSPGQDTQPAWSCDGNRIVFMSGRDGNGEIYVMNADGSDQTRLTSTEFQSEWSPQWAHNDEKILFSAPYDEGNWEIYMMDADGSNVIRLTEEKGDDRHATWLEIE
jgi:tol-pal system beta propeller repeat protein TolB